MTVAIAAFFQQTDAFGEPLSGGKVWTYAAGTTNPLASYTDESGSVPNANPVILDSAGRAQVWLTANVAYKLVLMDADDVVQETTDDFYAGASPEQLALSGIVPSTGGTYTGPVIFTGGVSFSGDPTENAATLESLALSGVQNANLWTNPDFQTNQRGAASVADGAYGFDRSVVLASTGSVTLSQLAQPTDGIPYAMRMTQPDASAKRIGTCQIIEARNCLVYRGGNLVFVPKVRCSVATTIRVALVAWTGTADSPTRDVVNTWTSTDYTAGNFFVVNTSTIAVGAAAVQAAAWTDVPVSSASAGGVVAPTGMNNLYLVVWTDSAQAQNVTLDLSVMRAGRGTSVPIWTPPDVAVELAKCQRYFLKTFEQGVTPVQNVGHTRGAIVFTALASGGAGFRVNWVYPVEMRALPAITTYNPQAAANSWRALGGSGTVNYATGTHVTGTRQADMLSAASFAGSEAYSIHATADAELGV